MNQKIKWKEIWYLFFLNASVVISWIAYHEYQPVLLENFGFTDLAFFALAGKVAILILIPPIAGFLSDKTKNTSGKNFLIYTIGISITALTFMSVASTISIGSESFFVKLLPVLIIIWLISMNIFYSPANSLIEFFAPGQEYVKVMAVLVAGTELIYALEPLVVGLVTFLGPTLTFVTGGVLISTSGYLFYKVSKDEVDEKIKGKVDSQDNLQGSIFYVILFSLIGGLAHSMLISYMPNLFNESYSEIISPEYFSFAYLAIGALFCLVFYIYSDKVNSKKIMNIAMVLVVISFALLNFISSFIVLNIAAFVTAIAFSSITVNGLPYIFKNMKSKYVTLIVGLYFGLLEVFDGLFEILYF